MIASTVVLLHGSLIGPWCWDRVTPELTAAGHRVVAPALPYGDGRSRSREHLDAIVRALAETEAGAAWEADGRPPAPAPTEDPSLLTFVAHSLAGLLAPAIAERFPAARIVYLAALLPSPGRSLVDQLDDEPEMYEPEWIRWGAPPVWEDGDRARRFLFHDADERTAAAAIARLRPDSPTLALERAPEHWPRLRADSICPTGDRTISPAWMRGAARDRLATEPLDLDAGHCPQVGQPRRLAALLATVLARPIESGAR